jgi:shikimate kinase
MATNTSIFLIGPMGAGKSAVGRRLAQTVGLEFRDSDEEIEQRTGVDIPFIFEKEGEEGFRKREIAVVDELTQLESVVLATGGGAATDADSRRRMASRGTVVYLYATVNQQQERTRRGRERPLLLTGDPRKVLEELMEVRDPQYREIADIVVETDGRKVNTVANEIQEKLSQLPGAR